jgi:hypothetical protein
MIARLLAVAGVATGLTVTLLSVTPSAAAARKPFQQCMTDDGYGRFRPCSALYKREHPNWRAGPECMTDDGYGRYRPCSSFYLHGGSNGYPGQTPPSPTFPGTKQQPAY